MFKKIFLLARKKGFFKKCFFDLFKREKNEELLIKLVE